MKHEDMINHAQRYGSWYSGKKEGGWLAEFLQCRIISVISGFKLTSPRT